MDYIGRTNLLKFKNALITECKGKTTTKKGVFIPIEDNDLYVSLDENLRPRGVMFDFISWELKGESKFGDTHLIKQSFSKDFRESMSEEELKNQPIFGNMRPVLKSETTIEAQAQVSAQEDDLPF